MANILTDGDALLYFPEDKIFVFASEGTGDNLLSEDIDNGYVDYIDWTSYSLLLVGEPVFSEEDGGMVMSKKYVSDMTDEEIIKALRYEAGIDTEDCIKLY